jgi:diguanylate cyclase (GGDEF)-like protein
MSAAVFILAINLCVAAIFATAFGVVAAYARSAISARWLAAAYAMGMLSPLLEYVLPYQTDPRPVSLLIFMSFLVALCLCVAGLSRHYRLQPPWRVLIVVVAASLMIQLATVGMPRESLLRATLYQLPYFVVQVIGVAMILQVRRRKALDVALLVLFAASGLQFLGKPFLAAAIGSGGSAQSYIGSTYAAISQTAGALLLIINGLLMLLIIVRDAMAEMTARSETDTLSGLFNRRGFEERGERLLTQSARTNVPMAMVVADLDHFKDINDTHGHAAGDAVIAAFAQMLDRTAPPDAVVGRLGGEEFAVFMSGTNLVSARLFAEAVRSGLAGSTIGGLDRQVSASFGVAQIRPGDRLSDALRRADAALYDAKKAGRNRVSVAQHGVVGRERRNGSRR